MEISIVTQLITTLYSILLGAFLGVIYDGFKILKLLFGIGNASKLQEKINNIKFPLIKKFSINKQSNNKTKKEKILHFILDFIFFVFITPIILIFIYATSSGVVRWYVFVGAIFGFFIYIKTLDKMISPVIEILLLSIKILFSYFLFFIKFPFIKILNLIKIRLHALKIKFRIKQENKLKNIQKSNRKIITEYGKFSDL